MINDEENINFNDAENYDHKNVKLPSIKQLRQSIAYYRRKNQMLTDYLKKYDEWREELIKSTNLFLKVKSVYDDDEIEDKMIIEKNTTNRTHKADVNEKNAVGDHGNHTTNTNTTANDHSVDNNYNLMNKNNNDNLISHKYNNNLNDFLSKRSNETDFWPPLSPDKRFLIKSQHLNIQADALQPIPINQKIQKDPNNNLKADAENDSNDFDFDSSNNSEDLVIETFSQKNKNQK